MAVPDVTPHQPWQRFYEPGVPTRLEYPERPLTDFLAENATRFRDRVALIFEGRALTYRELDRLATRFAACLANMGVTRGDRVALLLPNVPQMVVAYYGTLRAGAVVVPTNPLYVEREIEQHFNATGAKVAVVLSRLYPTVRGIRARTSLEHVFVTSVKDFLPPVTRALFSLLKERPEGHAVALERGEPASWLQDALRDAPDFAVETEIGFDDLALLQPTGGTTGTARAAMLSHRNLVCNTWQIRSWLANCGTAPDRPNSILGVIPFFHIYGMTTVMNFAIMTASTMILVPRFDLAAVLKAIQRHRPNLFPGVPTMYMAINRHRGIERYDLTSIAACVSGAAPLPHEVQEQFEQLTGARLVEGYGLTEASPVTHCNPLRGTRKSGSIGVPLPDTEARIVDLENDQRVLAPGEVGELEVRGPQVMLGYWNQADETRQVLRNGWLKTGDIARMDDDGFFYIVDRKKDMIISGGMNVYPRDVEEVLFQHPSVAEAVVVGVPDEHWGEVVKAFVVLRPDATVTPDELIAYCRERMAAYKVPKEVEFRSELPKSMIGKFLRRVLLEEELARRGQG